MRKYLIYAIPILGLFTSCFAQGKLPLEETPPEKIETKKVKFIEARDTTKDRQVKNGSGTLPTTSETDTLQTNDSFVKAINQKPEFEGLILEQDKRIDLLCQQYMENKKIKGYRIQIYSGSSRQEASRVKSEFISLFPKITPPDLIYHPPNFKLRVGNYRDRLAAQKQLIELKKEFPSSFLVKDEIKIEFKD